MRMTRYGAMAGLATFVTAALSPLTVAAEDVFVKYRGMLNIDRMNCEPMGGSFIHRLCFHPPTGYTVVLLGGTYYHYCNVPPRVIVSWTSADSMGRYYNTFIKGNYDCRLAVVPTP